ncbi:hypothetical protein Pst134EA_026948 [Puccinia striiformis f. sp. tritici]|uniref:hypothetical protein n=1 Tax=Puccinia striiformis f. sp. tritici TaxID=168172 RepID=UPI002007B0FF|nr:hypothetical protein Pst134EA_026948 [Puccinia striiformis f. sp. tritici]KAH9450240.1 hypothetical protein Pst134EA_026948 [Puccinia striiformis f. sp. tritici]
MLRVLHSFPDRNLNFDTPPPHFEYLRSKSNQRNHIPPLRSSPLDSTGPSSLTTIGTPHLLIFLPSIPRIKLPREPTINKPSKSNQPGTYARQEEYISPGFPTTFEIPPLFTLSTTRPVTPLENIKLIEDTFTLVKQQRLNRPPKLTPNQDYLLVSSEERLNRIVAQFRLKQENKLEHQIFLNRSPRVPSPQEAYQESFSFYPVEEVKEPYRIVEKAIAALLAKIRSNPNHINFLNFRPDAYQRKAKWLLSELKKNRTNGAKEESQYLAFVQLYGDYKEELAKARKLVNTPCSRNQSRNYYSEEDREGTAHSSAKKAKPTVPPNLEPTGNVLLDAHIAKKAANELKAIVPLDISDTSTIESTDSLFTTKPFELTDLFPKSLKEKISAALSSTPKAVATPISTKATPISKLLVVDDSDNEGMDNHPHSTPDLTTLNQEEREAGRKEDQPTPIVKLQEEKSRSSSPSICGDYPRTPIGGRGRSTEQRTHPDIGQQTRQNLSDLPHDLVERRSENLTRPSSREPEGPPQTHRQPSGGSVHERLESMGREEETLPSPTEDQEQRQEATAHSALDRPVVQSAPQLQTPQGTQHRSQGSREVETTRSSDDNTQTHASPHVVNHVPQRWYVTLQIPK